ncbi:VOC family protein [Pseudomonas sp. UL073]|uniref:VOC family protein n=1 Tax=Zestomonas insulae TaxID=2809017 RepID=A0ABS2IBL3_9GAMM|nr:VOC family protein [Pseudomonas insulae]MBM7060165.1 VOC family protein [Pseudomonas insulae]
MQVQPYLFFNGRCEEALAFYGQAIGAQTTFLMRFKEAPDMPPSNECGNIGPEHIMHANLTIGSTQVMASDGASPDAPGFRGFSLSVTAANPAEAEQAFNALLDGGQVVMPLQETFWAKAFGMLVDRFGVHWMVNCEK